jgi:predicted  nucleic acid-binding Zn-ribbon protein
VIDPSGGPGHGTRARAPLVYAADAMSTDGGVRDERLDALDHRAARLEAELRAAEREVLALRRREERILSLLAEAERRRRAAEHWLGDHRSSVSWRITEPLRAAKRLRVAVRARPR